MVRLLFLFMICAIPAMADEPPQAVIVTTAQEQSISPNIVGVGTFTPYNDVVLKAETSGRVETIHFKDGARAKPNQKLFTFHNKEQEAKFKKAEATLHMSKNILNRKEKLIEKKFVTPQDLEQAQTQVDSDKADLDLAKEELSKTIILAPFDGLLSDRQISKGAYVIEGDELVRLQDITPIRLTFQIPQKDIVSVHVGDKVTASTDVYPSKSFAGEIEAIEPSVNEDTRSVTIYATFPNKDEKLIPGFYGRAELTTISPKRASLFIPEQALVIRPNGMHVYKAVGNKAVLTKITVGIRTADQAEVTAGLKKGDQIILEGQDKVHDGSPITIANLAK